MTREAAGSSRESPVVRPTARVVLLDEGGHVLLFRVTEPDRPEGPAFWITPGGGLEREETYEECAIRELREETGTALEALGPCIWSREHTWWFEWEKTWIRSVERYLVGRAGNAGVTRSYQTELEMQFLAGHRWWTVEEMRVATEQLVPRRFAELAMPLVVGDWPREPIPVGE